MESLDLPYANSILAELLVKDGIPITTLQKIATSYNTVVKVVDSLENEGLVQTEEKVVGRKTRFVYLTQRGRVVARYLGKVSEVVEGMEFSLLNAELMKEIRYIIQTDSTWKDEWDFITDSVRAHIGKWKRERSSYGNPRRYEEGKE